MGGALLCRWTGFAGSSASRRLQGLIALERVKNDPPIEPINVGADPEWKSGGLVGRSQLSCFNGEPDVALSGKEWMAVEGLTGGCWGGSGAGGGTDRLPLLSWCSSKYTVRMRTSLETARSSRPELMSFVSSKKFDQS